MTDWIYRIQITDHNSVVRRYATRSYTTTGAHVTIPNTFVDGRLQQPLLLRRDLYGQGRTYGDVDIAHGEAVILNSDGALDSLRILGFDQRLFEVWRVDPDNVDADSRLIFRGLVEELLFDFDVVRVLVRDLTYVFDRALQTTKYAGDNALPAGLEGVAEDLKGKVKPRAYGDNYNLSPPLVNTSRLIYQLTDAALLTSFSLTVYDKRVALSAGILRTLADFQAGATTSTVSSIDTATDIITFTALHNFATADPVHVDATTTLPGGLLDTQYYYARNVSSTTITLHPTAADATGNTNIVDITSAGSGTITVAKNRTPYGRYDWCSDAAGSYIRTGSQATRLTVDLRNGTTTDARWDEVMQDIMAKAATDYTDIDTLAFIFTDRVSLTDTRIGVYFDSEITIYEALREVARSVGASFACYPENAPATTNNFLWLQRLFGTVTGNILELSDASNTILKDTLRRIQPSDHERSIPAWRINVHYKRNRTVMSPSDLAGVAASEIAFAELEYRTSRAEYSSYKTVYPGSPEMEFVTALTVEADASALATHIGTRKDPDTQMFTVSVPMEVVDDHLSVNPGMYGMILADTKITLTHSRFGLDAGVSYRVIGCTLDYEALTAELTLWGPP